MTTTDETGGARRFSAWFKVRYYEADAVGHVNNASWLHYLEQAAIEHSDALGFTWQRYRALGGMFIVRRHEIDYLLPARPGDILQVVTWPVEIHGARAIRAYEVYRAPGGGATATATTIPADGFLLPGELPDGELLLRAQTLWVWVDLSGHPRRAPAELIAAFVG